VHAAVGGAAQTQSLDMSNTISRWAQRNLALNGTRAECSTIRPRHADRRRAELAGACPAACDCVKWLATQKRRRARGST